MIRTFVAVGIFLIGLTTRVYATTYPVGPGQAYQSFAQLFSAVTPAPGDIIDGGGNVFYERLIIPSSGSAVAPIVYRNFTLDGTLSIDDMWTFSDSGNYEETAAWIPKADEIHSKKIGRCPQQMLEDGKYMQAVAASGALSSRGTYQCKNSEIYYRASDGLAPSKHKLRASRRDLEAQTGLLIINDRHYITLENVDVQNHLDANNVQGSVVIVDSTNISYRSGAVTRCGVGVQIISSSNIGIGSYDKNIKYALAVSDNYFIGVTIQGDGAQDIVFDGLRVTRSGFYKYLTPSGAIYQHGGDADNFSIGGIGGNISRVTIKNSLLEYSGPIGTSSGSGANIFVGTSNPMIVTDLVIDGNLLIGSNGFGASISPQVKTAAILNNIFYKNTSIRSGFAALRIGLSGADSDLQALRDIEISGNRFLENMDRGGIVVTLGAAGLKANAIRIKNNLFCNSDVGVGYRADLYLEDSSPYPWLKESGNVWRKKNSANDLAALIKAGINGPAYDKYHLVGATVGFWQHDSNKGQGSQVNDTDEGTACQLLLLDINKRLNDFPMPMPTIRLRISP